MSYWAGVTDGCTKRAFIYTLQAARLMNVGHLDAHERKVVAGLLDMAKREYEPSREPPRGKTT
jgi:hypothetical protein